METLRVILETFRVVLGDVCSVVEIVNTVFYGVFET